MDTVSRTRAAQQCVHADDWILTGKLALYLGLGFSSFVGESTSLQPPLTRAISPQFIPDIEKGRVVHLEGGEGARYLEDAIARHGDTARVIAELGIGTNPMARLQGNIITDEKALGTIHIAIGRNDFIGGRNMASTHIDGVVSQPNLEIDGNILIDHGKHSHLRAG